MSDTLLKYVKDLIDVADTKEGQLYLHKVGASRESETLLEAVRLLKMQVTSKIIAEQISNTPRLQVEIEDVRTSLEETIKELQKQIDELEERNNEPSAEQEDIESYKEKKQDLESSLEKANEMLATIEDKGKLLETLYPEITEPETAINEKTGKNLKQHLIDTCATVTAVGYMSIQTLAGEPLFKNETRSNFNGYEITSMDKVREFVELADKLEDLGSANNYLMKTVLANRSEKELQKTSETYERDKRLQVDMQVPGMSGVLDNMEKISKLYEEYSSIRMTQDREESLVEVKRNPFARLFDRIKNMIGKNKQSEDRLDNKTDLSRRRAKVAEEINGLAKNHQERMEKDEGYRIAFEAYTKLQDGTFGEVSKNNEGKTTYSETRTLTSKFPEPGHELSEVPEQLLLYAEHVSDFQERSALANRSFEQTERRVQTLQEQRDKRVSERNDFAKGMSDEAKRIVDTYKPEEIAGFVRRFYVNAQEGPETNREDGNNPVYNQIQKSNLRYSVSPIAALATLNILSNDEISEETLAKVGETVNNEEVVNAVELAGANLAKFAEAARQLSEETKQTTTRNSDEER